MENERIIHLLNQVERNAGAIYIREYIDGEWRNVPLLDLPTHLAIKHICRLVRIRLEGPVPPARPAMNEAGPPDDKAEIFARRIVSYITEGNTGETFEADVDDVAEILREFVGAKMSEAGR